MKQTVVRMIRDIVDEYLVQDADSKDYSENLSASGISIRSDIRAGCDCEQILMPGIAGDDL